MSHRAVDRSACHIVTVDEGADGGPSGTTSARDGGLPGSAGTRRVRKSGPGAPDLLTGRGASLSPTRQLSRAGPSGSTPYALVRTVLGVAECPALRAQRGSRHASTPATHARRADTPAPGPHAPGRRAEPAPGAKAQGMRGGATASSILSNGRRSRAHDGACPAAEIACPLALRDDETTSIPAGRAARSAGRQAGRRRVMSRAPGTNRAASRRTGARRTKERDRAPWLRSSA